MSTTQLTYKPIDKDHWYMSLKLHDEVISYLWDQIKVAEKENIDYRSELAGNISRSLQLKDPDNIIVNRVFHNLFESELKYVFAETIDRYVKVFYTNAETMNSTASVVLKKFWVNYQKKGEYNPLHDHSGMFSFVIWMKIPYNIEDEMEVPWVKGTNSQGTSGSFILVDKSLTSHQFSMSKDMEGYCVFFPSNFAHMVYPFYTSDEDRISISGNIFWQLEV